MPTLSAILEELGTYPGLEAQAFTTGIQASPPDGAYIGIAAGADATRQIVSTDLADLNLSGDGSDTDPSLHSGSYLWLPSLDLQRRIAADGYAPAEDAASATDQGSSTETVGVLTLARTLGTTVAAGVNAQIHSPLPPMYDADRKMSLRSAINKALDTLRMPVRLSLTGVANSYRYSLASYPWLRDEGDLIRVSDRELISDHDPYMLPGRSYLRFDGATTYLIVGTAIASGQTFYADVYRRRKTWIAVTGEARATATAGAITAITVTKGGTYTTTPTVTISGAGTGATAHAVLTNGAVSSIVIDTAGTGYVTATTIVTLSAGAFASSTVGLVNPEDVCTGSVREIALLAYWFCCEALKTRDGQGTDVMWAANAQRVAGAVAPYLQWGQPEGPQPSRRDYGYVGDSPEFLRRRESGGGSRRWG